MTDNQGNGSGTHASSTGQLMSGAAWLDVHFEACRPEYEASLRSVGIQPGWRVLDAGCGSGSYLPLLAELVEPTGALIALDLAEDNVATVLDRASSWHRLCPIEARVGNVTALPLPDNYFDAVWCANTSQYLTDDELTATLAEFRRVVRPGGLVAIKEFDGTMVRFLPAPPNIFPHGFEAAAHGGMAQAKGTLRTPALGAWLRRAGLTNIRLRTTLVERSAPLAPTERQLWGDYFTFWSSVLPRHDIPAADRQLWERLSVPAEQERILRDPDFICCEGYGVAVGSAPERG